MGREEPLTPSDCCFLDLLNETSNEEEEIECHVDEYTNIFRDTLSVVVTTSISSTANFIPKFSAEASSGFSESESVCNSVLVPFSCFAELHSVSSTRYG